MSDSAVLSGTERRAFDRAFDKVRAIDPTRVVPRTERYQRTVRNLVPGAVLILAGRTYLVEEVFRYTETSEDFQTRYEEEVWTELKLFCFDDLTSATLEWEEDDEIEASMSVREIAFADVRDDASAAVDEDDLDPAAEEEDSLFVDGVEYAYEDDYAAVFSRDGRPDERAYLYEFRARDGSWLTVEEWQAAGGEEYQLWISRPVAPDDIEVVALP